MMVAMGSFAFNDALVKTLGGVFGAGQVLAVRGSLAGVLILVLLWQRGLLRRWPEALVPIVLLRAAFELAGTLAFLAALVRLPFATISAILQALPLAVTLGAALVFRERVGWRRWLAILVGFGGVMLVIRPGAEAFDTASLWMLLCVACAAGRDLSTRAMPPPLPSLLVSATTIVFGAIGGFGLCLVQGEWVALTGTAWRTLALAALFLLLAHQFIVLAMRRGDVAVVVPFRYTNLLWAIALGLWLFDERPDRWTLLGAAVIVSTGLFTLYRETRRGASSSPVLSRR